MKLNLCPSCIRQVGNCIANSENGLVKRTAAVALLAISAAAVAGFAIAAFSASPVATAWLAARGVSLKAAAIASAVTTAVSGILLFKMSAPAVKKEETNEIKEVTKEVVKEAVKHETKKSA